MKNYQIINWQRFDELALECFKKQIRSIEDLADNGSLDLYDTWHQL
ncbi:MAG TPA: hypothetical protein P5123_11965 [Spirochaetota bacterium]|nr:hypothetical protein [Spirochaetota bacterium]